MSVIGLAFAAALLFLVVRYASRNPDKADLGAAVVRVDAEEMAEHIAEEGPRPYPDPYGRRGVYLQHVGDDPKAGWILVDWYPPGENCPLQWNMPRQVFESCSGRTYPPDGSGLTTYPAPVEDGRVVIDLRGG